MYPARFVLELRQWGHQHAPMRKLELTTCRLLIGVSDFRLCIRTLVHTYNRTYP